MKTRLAFCLLALVFSGCDAQKPPAAQPPAAASQEAEPPIDVPASSSPDEAPPANADAVTIEVKDFQGLQKLIESKRGRVVVMDCWSTWCAPCVKEFPGLVKLHEKYGPDRLACISLSFNFEGGKNETPQEHEADVLDFLRGQKATFDNVLASVPAEDLYGLLGFETAAIPAIFVYDREGKIARRFEGADAKYSDVEKLVAKLVE